MRRTQAVYCQVEVKHRYQVFRVDCPFSEDLLTIATSSRLARPDAKGL